MSVAKKNLKKIAKNIRRHGRYGDTELVHMSPQEIKLLEKMSGTKPTINPVTGLKEYWAWLIPAAVSLGTTIYSNNKAKSTAEAATAKQEELARKQAENEIKALEASKQVTPAESRAMASLEKGAEQGTMDVEGLNRQMAQPIYQQGQAQQAQALAQITTQGLEGSIIAQEVAQKIGGDVRASIADQARSIAMANEQTKESARREMTQQLFARGDRLRQIALNKKRVESGLDLLPLQSEIANIQTQGNYEAAMASGIGGAISQGVGAGYSHYKDYGTLGFPGSSKAPPPGGTSGSSYSGPSLSGNVSDIALKENISLVGKSKSNINIYEFEYIDKKYGDGRYSGVMAQEVPQASFEHEDGYLWVDYNKIDVDFKRIN
tara:strand:+ start:1304 stop:2434 length:1131 start_codon:yes stop_codon:yes gene_type:complete